FKTVEGLIASIKPHVTDEQRSLFNLFEFIHSEKVEEENIEKELFILLSKALVNLDSPAKRQELVQYMRRYLEQKGLNYPELFEHLSVRVAFDPLPIRSLYLMCIENLIAPAPEAALQLWQYVEKDGFFADSAVDELKAFAYIHGMQMK